MGVGYNRFLPANGVSDKPSLRILFQLEAGKHQLSHQSIFDLGWLQIRNHPIDPNHSTARAMDALCDAAHGLQKPTLVKVAGGEGGFDS